MSHMPRFLVSHMGELIATKWSLCERGMPSSGPQQHFGSKPRSAALALPRWCRCRASIRTPLVNREVLPDMDLTGFSDSLPRSNLACPQNRGCQSPPRGRFFARGPSSTLATPGSSSRHHCRFHTEPELHLFPRLVCPYWVSYIFFGPLGGGDSEAVVVGGGGRVRLGGLGLMPTGLRRDRRYMYWIWYINYRLNRRAKIARTALASTLWSTAR